MQRMAGLFALLVMLTITNHASADHGYRFARQLGYRWSAGYHWRSPGHDSSYYNPWSGHQSGGCGHCGTDSRYNQAYGQSLPRVSRSYDQSSGFNFPRSGGLNNGVTFQQTFNSIQAHSSPPQSLPALNYQRQNTAHSGSFGYPSGNR